MSIRVAHTHPSLASAQHKETACLTASTARRGDLIRHVRALDLLHRRKDVQRIASRFRCIEEALSVENGSLLGHNIGDLLLERWRLERAET